VNFSAISVTANTSRFSPAESIECGLGILAERLFLRAEFASATCLRINLDLADRTGIGIGRNRHRLVGDLRQRPAELGRDAVTGRSWLGE